VLVSTKRYNLHYLHKNSHNVGNRLEQKGALFDILFFSQIYLGFSSGNKITKFKCLKFLKFFGMRDFFQIYTNPIKISCSRLNRSVD